MTMDEWNRAIRIVDRAFDALAGAPGQGQAAALKAKLVDGKLYELRVLSWLLARMTQNGLTASLINGPDFMLHHNPGAVDRQTSYIELRDPRGNLVGEIWCNVEFVGIGFEHEGGNRQTAAGAVPLAPDYHELDIAVVWGAAPDGQRVSRQIVAIACECKDRALEKRMLREMLGLRRELSYMRETSRPSFPLHKSTPIVSQDPPTRLFLCTSSPLPKNYARIAKVHAIHVVHVQI